MNKIFFLGLTLIMFSSTMAAELTYLDGRFACEISYVETSDLSIPPGEDFPVGDFYSDPVEREETLLVDFKALAGSATVINPEVLPSWLFITPEHASQQNSFSYLDTENRSVVYEVEWNNTWYFGSQVVFETVSTPKNGLVKMNITFDDNDGWAQTLKYVSCVLTKD